MSKADDSGKAELTPLQPFDAQRIFDPEAVAGEIRLIAEFNARTIAEIGARLLWAKEQMPRGEFDGWLPTTGVSRTTAYRYMQVARTLSHGGTIRPAIGTLPASKAYALLDLPDDELAELHEGKEVRGRKLDEFDSMTRSEIMEWARAERAANEKGQRQNEKLRAKLEEERARKSRRPEEAHELIAGINGLSSSAALLIEDFEENLARLLEGVPGDTLDESDVATVERHLLAALGAHAGAIDRILNEALEAFENPNFSAEKLPEEHAKLVRALTEVHEKALYASREAQKKVRREQDGRSKKKKTKK